jgi:hypothetical protein
MIGCRVYDFSFDGSGFQQIVDNILSFFFLERPGFFTQLRLGNPAAGIRDDAQHTFLLFVKLTIRDPLVGDINHFVGDVLAKPAGPLCGRLINDWRLMIGTAGIDEGQSACFFLGTRPNGRVEVFLGRTAVKSPSGVLGKPDG